MKKRFLIQILIALIGAASILAPTLLVDYFFGATASYITSCAILLIVVLTTFILAMRNKDEFFK